MNILVTGSNGQLGNELRNVSAGSVDNYVFTDVAELDITDARAVADAVARNNADVIVNCAAYTNVERAEDEEPVADLLNHRAARNLALAAKDAGATLIHMSTDYVFSGNACLPIVEASPTHPIGAYGRTKLAGEQAIMDSGCNYIILRTAWLYSPYGNNFVKTMRRLTAEKDSLRVVFDQVGTPTCAADLASLICHIIARRMLHHTGIYHYSNEGVCSWYDFACAIRDFSGNKCTIIPCHSSEFPTKARRPHFSVLDKSRVKATFGIDIPHWIYSLRQCIARM